MSKKITLQGINAKRAEGKLKRFAADDAKKSGYAKWKGSLGGLYHEPGFGKRKPKGKMV